jgi:hypothetical protein
MKGIPVLESQFHRTQRTPAAGRSCRPEAGALRGRALSLMSKVDEIFVMATKKPRGFRRGAGSFSFRVKTPPLRLAMGK